MLHLTRKRLFSIIAHPCQRKKNLQKSHLGLTFNAGRGRVLLQFLIDRRGIIQKNLYAVEEEHYDRKTLTNADVKLSVTFKHVFAR